MAETADWGPSGVIEADSGYAAARPRLSFVDLILQLWRAKWIMMLIALPIFALGLYAAFQMPKSYESRSSLYVTSGDEVRSSSILSNPDFAQGPDTEQVIQGELEILRTKLVAERTLSRFPMDRLYPKLAEAQAEELAKTPPEQVEAVKFEYFQKSVQGFGRNFWSSAAPNSNVISVGFKHEDPEVAAEVLTALMATYLNRRAELFGSRPVDQLTAQRKRFEGELLQAEDAIRDYLRTNNIGDFGSERSTAQGLFTAISSELSTVRARTSAIEGQLATTRTQFASTPAQLELFVEDTSAERLRDLEIERNQALVSYTPDSRRVQAIDKQIEDLRAFIAAQSGLAGTTRRGPNPTYQALESSLNTLEAEAQSLSGQRAELERQLGEIEAKLTRFSQLEPIWSELQRNRDLMESNVRAIAEREQQEGAIAGITAQAAESVKITEPPTVPIKGSSLKFPVAVLSLLLAGFTALVAGLLYTFTRQGFSTPGSLRRTTGLPVLGVIGRR